eukprot:3472993-Rhodomonas_salina.1
MNVVLLDQRCDSGSKLFKWGAIHRGEMCILPPPLLRHARFSQSAWHYQTDCDLCVPDTMGKNCSGQCRSAVTPP